MSNNKLRDNMWLWGHQVDGHYGDYNIKSHSRMTPAEASMYVGIPNVIMVDLGEKASLPPDRQEALAVSSLQKVVWSVRHPVRISKNKDFNEDESITEDIEKIHNLADEFDNINGVILDDFQMEMERPGTTPQVMKEFSASVKNNHPFLDTYVVVYDHMLDSDVWYYLKYFDVVTLWTWESKNLENLEATFNICKEKIGDKQLLLGLYLYDYGGKKPMSVKRMKYQCEFALEKMKKGQISGMIFLASCICDLNLDAIKWTKDWIKELGDKKI